MDEMNRRVFLAAMGVLGVKWAAGPGAALPAGLLPKPAGEKEFLPPTHLSDLAATSFEPGQVSPLAPHHQVVEGGMARSGLHSLMGGAGEARMLEVPFEAKKGSILQVLFWARGEKGGGCGVYVKTGGKRIQIAGMKEAPGDNWKHLRAFYPCREDVRGTVQVAAPDSMEPAPGRVWIDDLAVTVIESDFEWPARVEDFPALACDRSGGLRMAVLERIGARPSIVIYGISEGSQREICRFQPQGCTGLGAPALAALDQGCIAAFPVEQGDGWRIAWAYLGGDDTPGADPALNWIDAKGTADISPALAAQGERACLVFESNGGGSRAIHACLLEKNGRAGEVRRISSPKANSYNPAVAALENGSIFAAWDSVRREGADIQGAWCVDGEWRQEHRITSDARIERHPSLAVWKDQVWMAWQAQGYEGRFLNSPDEQRIAVARLAEGSLEAPLDFFERIANPGVELVRPRIAFDEEGRLWLTARQSIDRKAGWHPAAWCYSGRDWQGPWMLISLQGRWRPVDLAWTPSGPAAAAQHDDLPWDWSQQGMNQDWRSKVTLLSVEEAELSPARPLETECLEMPATSFSLDQKRDLCAAGLPAQVWRRGGGELRLFFGDLHDHTDLSVCNRSQNPPGHDLFANVRDIEKLDFCALTDHGYNMDAPQWAYQGEQTRFNHDPGRFVTFLAQEWTSSNNPPAKPGGPNRYGHRNLIFLDPHHPRFYDAFDGDISPAELWKRIKGTDFICIPHQLADWQGRGKWNPPTDWSFTSERHQPVAEICQTRGSYEYLGCPGQARHASPFQGHYLQDAWARGIVIGVIASPDHGGGMGKAGVWAGELTRESLFEAIRARHTFGTSGAKMALRFSSGGAMMGDKTERPGGPIPFRISGLALREIQEAVIFRNNEIVHTVRPGKTAFDLEWIDEDPPGGKGLWYYTRIRAGEDEFAWSSPIWFV